MSAAAFVLDRVGLVSIGLLRQLGEISLFARETFAETWIFVKELRGIGRVSTRRRLSATFEACIEQMLEFGIRSVPVASITSAATGMVFALETGKVMIRKLGSPLFIGGIVSLGIVREIGPVFSALMVAARMGSSITAELGTMKVTEQVDAIRCLGENPIRTLVVPRFVAAVLMMPLLAVIADFVGIMGAFAVSTVQLGLSPSAFWSEFQLRVAVYDITHGLAKTLVFGAIVSIVACWKGFTSEGGAEGVGNACTESVVLSCMGILIADFLLTMVLF